MSDNAQNYSSTGCSAHGQRIVENELCCMKLTEMYSCSVSVVLAILSQN